MQRVAEDLGRHLADIGVGEIELHVAAAAGCDPRAPGDGDAGPHADRDLRRRLTPGNVAVDARTGNAAGLGYGGERGQHLCGLHHVVRAAGACECGADGEQCGVTATMLPAQIRRLRGPAVQGGCLHHSLRCGPGRGTGGVSFWFGWLAVSAGATAGAVS